jgi:lysophospholipase L1-like esterase
MGAVGVSISRPAALALGPVLLRQARRVRATVPLLPEAEGARAGVHPGGDSSEKLRLLVVGESTAAGVGATHQRDALSSQLAAKLAERHGRPVEWTVSARSGATVSYARRELAPIAPADQDLIVVALGVNDSMKLTPRRKWRAKLLSLIGELDLHLRPGGRLLLAGVPDLGEFRSLPQPLRAVLGWHARAHDRDLRRLARRQPNVVHAPMPPLAWPAMFAEDGFHPNAAAYEAWAERLAIALDETTR